MLNNSSIAAAAKVLSVPVAVCPEPPQPGSAPQNEQGAV